MARICRIIYLFIVCKGKARIQLDKEIVIVKENESYLVEGKIPHSIWDNIEEETIMIGISVE